MSKELRHRKVMTTTINAKLVAALEQLSKDTRIPKSKLIDEALELLLKQHGRPVPEPE